MEEYFSWWVLTQSMSLIKLASPQVIERLELKKNLFLGHSHGFDGPHPCFKDREDGGEGMGNRILERYNYLKVRTIVFDNSPPEVACCMSRGDIIRDLLGGSLL